MQRLREGGSFLLSVSISIVLILGNRAMALKALDQRLANNSSPSGSSSTNPPAQSRDSSTLGRADRGSPPPITNGGPNPSNTNVSEEAKS